MWKIQRLYLQHFVHIYSGMGKEEITLDLSKNDKTINIFIGKIGSGKSAILGHLQPFATYGTLDVRNQDDPIMPNVNGLKEIDYIHDHDIFEIVHVYTWNKHTESHNVKSYIKMNGEELNPNGNSGSFKELIKIHFGIEQNFLRLLRLGPNVANVINMKATERKSFIASLMTDTDVYLMLHKHLSEDLRKINTTLAVLSKKLVSLSSDQEDKLKASLRDVTEDHQELSTEYEQEQTQYFMEKGMVASILQGKTFEEYQQECHDIQSQIETLEKTLISLKESASLIDRSKSLSELMKEIGSTELIINQITAQATLLDEEMKNTNLELTKWKERKALLGEKDHMADLKKTLAELEIKYEDYKRRVAGFTSSKSYRTLASFIDSLSITVMQIDSIAGYTPEMISLLYHSDRSILTHAAKKIDMCRGRIYNLQNQMSNLKFSAQYQTPYPLIRPPMCPTVECPFIQSHPAIIKDYMDELHNQDSPLRKLQDEIDTLNGKIAQYEEYPILYQKIQSLKDSWSDIKNTIKEFEALRTESLYSILTDARYRTNWYDHEKLTNALEKCKIQEELYDLEHRVNLARQELANLETESGGNIDDRISEAEVRHLRQRSELQRITEEKGRQSDILRELHASAEILEHAEEILLQISQSEEKSHVLGLSLQKYLDGIEQCNQYLNSMHQREQKLDQLTKRLKELEEKREYYRTQLNDIKFTRYEFDAATEAREVLKYIVDAVSTKEGIPLALVKIFLDDCRDILNDLISDVFVDALEILDFKIDDTDFKIPYSINGSIVDDIETASQGQRSIISIALSFALVRQSMVDYNTQLYNIMLLDEVEGSLYKRDRDKFLDILFKQLQAIEARQVFMITHNMVFDNSPANIIMTTEEIVDQSPNHTIIRLY